MRRRDEKHDVYRRRRAQRPLAGYTGGHLRPGGARAQEPGETTSLGAAIAAGVGVGLFESYEQAAQMVKTRSSHAVNPAWREAYAQMYPLYAMIYERMRPITDRLAALRS